MTDEAIKALKARMRGIVSQRRRAEAAAARQHAATVVASIDLAFLGPLAGRECAAYAALDDEFDPLPLAGRLLEAGARLSLPRITADRAAISFHRWRPGDPTTAGVWGIAEPLAEAPYARPCVVLVPLLAFDQKGWRLGYGGGYYDRALADLRRTHAVVTVGLAFACQEVESVPHLTHDQRLDWVLTERGPINTTG